MQYYLFRCIPSYVLYYILNDKLKEYYLFIEKP